jgi:elongator complex protein 3
MTRDQAWQEARQYTPEQLTLARHVLTEVRAGTDLDRALRRYPQPGGGHLPKHLLVYAYRQLTRSGEWPYESDVLRRIRMKPVRTLSGVTTVTVLTEPHPCPGDCVFCPTDARAPKSYLPGEPGARRAVQHAFDPYAQTRARLEALEAIGHPTGKIELLILGGTWSAYPRDYQAWFVRRCLDGLNGFEADSIESAQRANATAPHRNVGLVIETRPDHISRDEVVRLRALGVTKVQMGAQSLDDRLLSLNRRGHSTEDTRRAVALLRAAGFKIVLHWMPNLLGATPDSDRLDFARLWEDPGLRPDELKIYPTQLLAEADLHEHWRRGEYSPYSTEELVALIADIKPSVPPYCRINRVVRDIPSTYVVAGSTRSSLRMDVREEMKHRGTRCSCIRCREVRAHRIDSDGLRFEQLIYEAGGGEERFLSLATPEDRLAGYLRLSLPGEGSPSTGLADLDHAAIVREVHVYGQSLPLGADSDGEAQHAGLGARLMAEAEGLARACGFPRLAVIAALGTRQYYRRLGYSLGETYMIKDLAAESAAVPGRPPRR